MADQNAQHRGGKYTSAKERYALTKAGAQKNELQGAKDRAASLRAEAVKALYAYQEMTRMVKQCRIDTSNILYASQKVVTVYSPVRLLDFFLVATDPKSRAASNSASLKYRWGLNPWLNNSAGTATFSEANLKSSAQTAYAYYLRHYKAADAAQKQVDKIRGGTGNGVSSSKSNEKYITKGDLDALPAVYNVGAVKQAYFRANNAIQGTGGNTLGGKKLAYEGRSLTSTYSIDASGGLGLNSPAHVTDAMELWQTSMTNKGMLQTYFPPEGWSTNGDSTTAFPAEVTLHKYGFQFMFNPNSVNMTYQSTAQVDPAYEMAGKDKFNYLPAVGTGGTVSFSLMINRMFDLQYYDTTGHIAPQYKGTDLYPVREPYGPEGELNHKLFDEQKMIYEGGTMYDIEYLLRTLMGFTLQTELRHQVINRTADMGIYNLRPVELHLGPAMRYRGRVVSLNIQHVIFNERMVPMLSTVQIGFQRYPDYPFKKSSGTANGAAIEKFSPGA